MIEKDILSLVGKTITDKSAPFVFHIKPKNLIHKFLMKKGYAKSKLEFDVQPITVGNRWRVSEIAVSLPKDLFKDGKLQLEKAWAAINEHTDDFLYVVGICIQNNEKEPSRQLLRILRSMPEDKFYTLLEKSLQQAGVASFTNSIILINGQSVLNVQEKDANPAKEPA